MKKSIAILLILLAICFSLIDCTDQPEQPPTDTDGGSTTETVPGQSPTENSPTDNKEITKMYITVNGNKLEVNLAENSAVDALVEILKRGNIVYTANDYGGFEKVGSLGYTLPTSDAQITTQAGDVILYSGDQIVLFYGNNSYYYTRLGKINGYSASELRSLLDAGNGNTQVTISLE